MFRSKHFLRVIHVGIFFGRIHEAYLHFLENVYVQRTNQILLLVT